MRLCPTPNPMPKPVTVDLLHPTVVRAFTNWGYISFFGCIAALVTLLFFAIGQVKRADEARQVRQGGVAINEGTQLESSKFSSPEGGFSFLVTPELGSNDELSVSRSVNPQGIDYRLMPSSVTRRTDIRSPGIGVYLITESFRTLEHELKWAISSNPSEPGDRATLVLGRINRDGVEVVLLRQFTPYGSYRRALFSNRGYMIAVHGPVEDSAGCDFSRQALSDQSDSHSCGDPVNASIMDEVISSLRISS